MTADPAVPLPPEPERKRRSEPQPEAPWRLPRCDRCWYLLDGVGHFWACVAPSGRLRWPT